MNNHDDKYPSRLGFEPGTPRLQAPVETNEPSGPANNIRVPRQYAVSFLSDPTNSARVLRG